MGDILTVDHVTKGAELIFALNGLKNGVHVRMGRQIVEGIEMDAVKLL